MARPRRACGGTGNLPARRRNDPSPQRKVRTRHLELRFLGDIPVDGIDENEFLAACAFVTEPPPFEYTLVAEIVYLLNGTRHEFRRLHDADPHGRARHAQADFPVDG